MTASIVGWAHTPFGKFDTETVESLVVRVAREALADAGVSAADRLLLMARRMVAEPDRDDTGTNMPENCTTGTMAMMAAAKIAAVCVLANTDSSRPNPVLASTYSTPPRTSVAKLPLMGTPNRNTARRFPSCRGSTARRGATGRLPPLSISRQATRR